MPDAAELALDSNATGVIWRRLERVPGGSALGVWVVVVVLNSALVKWEEGGRAEQGGSTWKSPAPWSCQPDTESMRRVGSSERTRSVSLNSGFSRFSSWPQPSL